MTQSEAVATSGKRRPDHLTFSSGSVKWCLEQFHHSPGTSLTSAFPHILHAPAHQVSVACGKPLTNSDSDTRWRCSIPGHAEQHFENHGLHHSATRASKASLTCRARKVRCNAQRGITESFQIEQYSLKLSVDDAETLQHAKKAITITWVRENTWNFRCATCFFVGIVSCQ